MSWITRLRNALSPRRLDQDLADEIRDHLERREADLLRDGATPAHARVQARRVFGNVARIREQSRATRLAVKVESTVQDVRQAWRGLVRRPVFALTAILSLSLAAGAATAVYAIISAALFRPLPVDRPDRLVAFTTEASSLSGATAGDRSLFSYPLFSELRVAASGVSRVALFDDPHRAEVQVTGNDGPSDDVVSQFISPDAFDVLGVRPIAGQLFSPAEDFYPGARLAVVLSHDYWTRRFGADPAVIGQRLVVDGRSYLIAGVTPQWFRGVEPGAFVDVWRPITTFDPSVFTNPAFRSFRILGRLGPGTTRAQLAAQLQPTFHNHQEARIQLAAAALPVAQQAALRAPVLRVDSGEAGISGFRRAFARPLWILLGLALVLLLVACANVAGLLLARSTSRSAEFSLRAALGAGRMRVFRQLATEGCLIAALGVAGAWWVARLLAVGLLSRVSTAGNPVQLDVVFDARVLGFSVALCAVAAVLIGALPAWRLTARPPASSLRFVRRQMTRVTGGRVFAGVQIAFAFSLVVTGSAFVYSLRNLSAVNVGFDAREVTVLTMANTLGPAQRPLQLQLTHELEDRVGALPGVSNVSAAWSAMFTSARRSQRIVLPGGGPSEQEEVFYRVSPGYFDTLKIPILAGRDLVRAEHDDEPVASVVNRAFALKYFGTDAPLGRIFSRDDGVRHEVIGVAADARYDELRDGAEPIVYMPIKPPGTFTLYVRSPLPASTVATLVAREARALGSGLRVRDVTTLGTLVGNAMVTERLLAHVGGACGVLALMLAAIGLFGLLSYSVAGRTHEIGIRSALGARRSRIYALVLRDVGVPIACGLGAGLGVSLVAVHSARALLFGVADVDPIVISAATLTFLLTAAVACAFPARRAAGIDPVVALRAE